MRKRSDARKPEESEPESPLGETVTISMGNAQDALGDLVARARITGQRTVLTRFGKAVAAIVPIKDYNRLTAA